MIGLVQVVLHMDRKEKHLARRRQNAFAADRICEHPLITTLNRRAHFPP